MNKYLTFRENDKNGITGYYILQKASPHYLGRIVMYPIENSIAYAPVAGYNLYVNFDGALIGNFIEYYKEVIDQLNMLMIDMANWFAENRINENPKRYLKFKIKTT